MRGACFSDDRDMETAEVRVRWSGGCRGGRSSADDGFFVEVTGTPEALLMAIPKVLVM